MLKSKKINTKFVLIVAVVALLIALLGVMYFTQKKFTPNTPSQGAPARDVNSVDYSPPTPAQQEATRDPSPSFDSPAKDGGGIRVSITAANQNGNVLQIRTLIAPLVGSGECTLTLTREGQETITKTAAIQPLPSSSTCKGFDVPTDAMAKGQWTIKVFVKSDNNGSGSASQQVSIQ